MTFSHRIPACLSLHVTTIAIPVAAIPPVLFVYILLLFVFVSVSFCFCTLFVLAQCPHGRVFLWLILFGFSSFSIFGIWRIFVDFVSEQPPTSFQLHRICGSHSPGKDSLYIAHLISWLVHRSNAYLSLIIRASHIMVWSGIAGVRSLPCISRIRLAIWRLKPGGALTICFFFGFLSSLRNGIFVTRSRINYLLYVFRWVLDLDIAPFDCRSFDSLCFTHFIPSCREYSVF